MEEYLHVRCITCNKIIGDKWDRYKELLEDGVKISDALNKLGISRMCCRMRFLSPFKVPGRMDKQLETGLENTYNQLTIYSVDEPNAERKLVIPEVTIALPSSSTNPKINEIDLPAIPILPSPSSSTSLSSSNKPVRTYMAL